METLAMVAMVNGLALLETDLDRKEQEAISTSEDRTGVNTHFILPYSY